MALHSNLELLQLLLLLLVLFPLLIIAASKYENCTTPTTCGSVNITFPFGITEECSLHPSFLITCNRTSRSTHTPFFKNDETMVVLNISLKGELLISLPVASACYDIKSGNYSGNGWLFDLTPFRLEPKQNKLTVVGINSIGYMGPFSDISVHNKYTAQTCFTLYDTDFVMNGSCSGFGCDDTTIDQAISKLYYTSSTHIINSSYYNDLIQSYPCSHAFIAKKGSYNFSSLDIAKFKQTAFPVVLNWAVGNHTCEDAMKNASTYACISNHSVCQNSKVEPGYRCYCSRGFRGNAYLPDGCQDIDECMETHKYCDPHATCNNTIGRYKCSCPKGYTGDGKKKKGGGCQSKSKSDFKRDIILIIGFGVSVGILALLGVSFYIYWGLKKRRHQKIKEQFFQQNGGLLLQQQIARHRGSTEMIKIFSVEELKEATNNFDKDRVLGQGGQGTVYKGVLVDNRTIAIKKSKISEINQIEPFINEMIILSQINHRNVVKLLGCCLETKVPVLVYEFISNGTLYEHLHGQSSVKLTWKTRLRIATEIAGALAYLHSATSEPIIHRDVKTTNVLLDHNLTTKVSDFGASRIVPLDHTQITTLVQGTLGYLDPEYLHTSQLTEKSDVYSFGVVLAELLTGKKALSFDKEESAKNLAMYFVYSMKEGHVLDIVDSFIKEEANFEELMEFATLAKQCLKVKGDERPTMKEVSMELERVAKMHQQKSVHLSSEERESSLKMESYSFSVENDTGGSSGTNSHFDSLNQISMSLNNGR